MPAGVEQWVWVSDFHGFGFQDLNPGIAKVYVCFSLLYVCALTHSVCCHVGLPSSLACLICTSVNTNQHQSTYNVFSPHSFSEMSGSHYPERLGLFFVVDAPRIFNTLWRVVSQMVDPITKSKVRFVPFDVVTGNKSVLRRELQSVFDEELTEWLLREMQENRDKKINKIKVGNNVWGSFCLFWCVSVFNLGQRRSQTTPWTYEMSCVDGICYQYHQCL